MRAMIVVLLFLGVSAYDDDATFLQVDTHMSKRVPCTWPGPETQFSVAAEFNATIAAHNIQKGMWVGGSLIDGSPNEHAAVDGKSYVHGSIGGDKWNWNKNMLQGIAIDVSVNWERLKSLAQNLANWTDGTYRIFVINHGGTFNQAQFLGLEAQPENHGKTLIVFNTAEDVILDQTPYGRQFGPSVFAPAAKVILKDTAGYLDGFCIAKTVENVGAGAGALQMHGIGYTGPLNCGSTPIPTTTLPPNCDPVPCVPCSWSGQETQFSVVAEGNATIAAHNIQKGMWVGGNLIDGSPNEHAAVDGMSYVKGSVAGDRWNWNKNMLLGNNVNVSIDWVRLVKVAQNLVNWTDGTHQIFVLKHGGTFNQAQFLGLEAIPENYGKTLIVFDTTEDVILDQTPYGRQFGPSILAPRSSVTLKDSAGYLDGFCIGKTVANLGAGAGALQMHGIGYSGPLHCGQCKPPGC